MTAAAPAKPRAGKRASSPTKRSRGGHGRRLIESIEAFEQFPALSCARSELLGLLNAEGSTKEIVVVIESDAALTMATLRLANASRSRRSRAICGIPDAVASTSVDDLRGVVEAIPTFELLGPTGPWDDAAQRFRLHATATVRAAERLIDAGHTEQPDQLRVAALLHDIGKLVLGQAYEHHSRDSDGPPSVRLLAERREWGLDHALVGGVVARRYGVPAPVATLIERHHTDDPDAALLRVADMLAHYSAGHPVDLDDLVASAAMFGLAGARLDGILYGLPGAGRPARRVERSPLSPQQTAAIRLLAKGARYKQIGAELGIRPSTVRSHLHNAYLRLGVADRTQAVLLATESGWL